MVSTKDNIISLNTAQTRINLIIENDIQRSVNILSENYVPAARKYLESTKQIDSMKTDIDVMKKAIRGHSEQLKRIS